MTPSPTTPKVTPAQMPKNRDPQDTDDVPEESSDNMTNSDRAPETATEEKEEITRVGRNGIVNTEMPSHAANDQADIFYRDPITGKEHGPMPLSKWAEYSRNNGL